MQPRAPSEHLVFLIVHSAARVPESRGVVEDPASNQAKIEGAANQVGPPKRHSAHRPADRSARPRRSLRISGPLHAYPSTGGSKASRDDLEPASQAIGAGAGQGFSKRGTAFPRGMLQSPAIQG